MAGHSGTSLPKKLGIKDGARVALLAAPKDFEKTLELPPGARLIRQARGPLDVIVWFVTRQCELHQRFPRLVAVLETNGGLWVAWPKKASRVATDLSFDPVQAAGLHAGLVDNKVCAIDDTWSGLRFVSRVADRAALGRKPAV